MQPLSCHRGTRELWAAVALALVVIAWSGRSIAQTQAAPNAALDRASTLIQDKAFGAAATVLQEVLTVDPSDRRAREMLAFTLESKGDIDGERRVRAGLAAEYPNDASIQADYGRVLERSGAQGQALETYRRARALNAGRPDPELDAAIDRIKGRTAVELGTPVVMLSDPGARAGLARTGAAIPLGHSHSLALVATHQTARSTTSSDEATGDVFAASFVLRHRSGASMTFGPRAYSLSPETGGQRDSGVGGLLAGHIPMGPWLEADIVAEANTPWDEAAVTILNSGLVSSVDGKLFANAWSRRLLFQVGARRRALSILPADPITAEPITTERSKAWQSLVVGGVDVVLWRQPGVAVRGEMLDDALTAPSARPAAVTLAYRHYEVYTESTPEFATQIGLAPRGSVDELSFSASVASPRGLVGFEATGGVGRDAARQVPMWRGGGVLTIAPKPWMRFTFGYELSTEYATGFTGRRNAGWVSFHADI